MKKNLDHHTFGKTPACIYLAFHLTQLDDPKLAGKVGQTLTHFRELVRSLEKSSEAKIMTPQHVGSFAALLRKVAHEQHAKYSQMDGLVADLVRNIMMGEVKSLLRRASDAKHKFKDLQRSVCDVPPSKMAILLDALRPKVTDFQDDINAQTLIDKSLRKLERKGKISTLY